METSNDISSGKPASRRARSDPDLGLEHCVIGFPQKILTIAPSRRRDSHVNRDSKLRQVAFACGLLECLRQYEGIGNYLALKDGDIEEKSPGELITIADREAEECITCYLRAMSLDAIVIGEEAVGLQPSLTDALKTDATCCLRSRLLRAGLYYHETSLTSRCVLRCHTIYCNLEQQCGMSGI